MPTFTFEPTPFVMPGYEKADGDWSAERTKQISMIRELHPELSEWGLFAVGSAWGDYSQDIMAVGWIYEDQFSMAKSYNPDFLAYLYVRQLAPTFDFGGTGLRSEDIYELGQKQPWLGTEHIAPDWAAK